MRVRDGRGPGPRLRLTYLGPADGGELLVPRHRMTVKAVDSQETTGENGAAANVLDGDASARHVRLRATSEVGGNPWTSVAELTIGHRPRDVLSNGALPTG